MEFLQQNWYWAALAAVSGAFLLFDAIRQRGDSSSLSPVQATLKINREDALVIDVREQSEYAQGHIPNAKHIPLGAIEQRAGELESYRERPVILCCASGARSSGAAATLRKLGFQHVFNLQGGLSGWQSAGQPVSRKRKK
ncbi:rhodanese-like domain-containing protein [Nitrogeniibacter mangrovi]|uniref:Rhodanese-like domain-containing protein n=1 Tax=Nitrogeniibacter mangrovi TaxID=2016596 RepID=A0A6C1B4Y3_9RHOO|nr:rhodanese-like domain-containing protein [Nitrogeniibacter mangrovi]QID18493.1 rhodanese-like domain-containing protein [Nitrogeniibacter mangrovi]